MRTKLIIAVALVSIASSCGPTAGFRVVHRIAPTSSSIESIRHYSELHHGSRNLGEIGRHSVSPDGRFAAYELPGRLMLFDTRSAIASDITDGAFATARTFSWREEAGVLRIDYYGSPPRPPSEIRLPP